MMRVAIAVVICSTVLSVPSLAAQGVSATPARPDTGAAAAPGTGIWRNYDFVPGDTVVFATDFLGEPVGRFPASQLQYVRGNLQIVEMNGVKALEASSASVFRIALPRNLPDDFSLEFEIMLPAPNISTNVFFTTPAASIAAYAFDYVYVGGRPGIYRKGTAVSNLYMPRIQDRWVPVKLQVDSAYSIMYVGAERAAQVPVVNFPRSRIVEFHMSGNERLRSYLRNVVISVGLNDLYRALSTRGEFSTNGILFNTDSDRLLPESTPVLEQIRAMLAQHTDLKLQIEGHTDSQGDDAYNLALSDRRAASVRAYLIAQGIASARLAARGLGETVPVGDNSTAAGRRQNRRVVLRRMP